MMRAIILAGGLGTRLRPLTEKTPKPLLPIKGKPIIEHAIDNFKHHGIIDIIISIGYKADLIKKYLGLLRIIIFLNVKLIFPSDY